MTEHILQTRDVYWDAVQRGEKTFEVRRDDRGFQKGDTVVLRRMIHSTLPRDDWYVDRGGSFDSCRDLPRKISYILTGGQWGIEPGYVVLGLKK